ncbi:hypothetical protein [Pedobacter aquatilis]|uniref:hypothetical protein n=1 Tax=Pedobacter aquatilis TaxID=351343 RepID=UPI00292D9147|nr:hypothetical protein [Pedobacter aquatilis]
MDSIKSLADELRQNIKEREGASPQKIAKIGAEAKTPISSKIEKKLNTIRACEITGEQKIMIRLDQSTLDIIRAFKMVSGIEMTRLIVFSLRAYIEDNPWVVEYIKEEIKNKKI